MPCISQSLLAVMAPTVLATKYGINSCRTYAKRRLEAEG
jgi:hypothetical protein